VWIMFFLANLSIIPITEGSCFSASSLLSSPRSFLIAVRTVCVGNDYVNELLRYDEYASVLIYDLP
jgi:hypothetical protein